MKITHDDERIGQYCSKKCAQEAAHMETITTHRDHAVIPATTWRNLEPRTCWTVVLRRGV